MSESNPITTAVAEPTMAKKPNVVQAPATPGSPIDRLQAELLAGLRKSPKQLSPMWFYDERGSQLFEHICRLPEYYLTRTELGIMHRHADDMARHIGPSAALIEPGSGSSEKTRLLLDRLQSPSSYVPIDISRDFLLHSAKALAQDYPSLRIVPVAADFTAPFELPVQVSWAQRRVIYFPGSTIGNFELPEAQRMLVNMRGIIGRQGAILIGIDLKKDPEVLFHAYNDAEGVTAQFNLNALRHINRKLGADFDLGAFEHRAPWLEELGRIEMHLVSRREQTVHVGTQHIHFRHGEYLRTECSHKYTLEGFAEMARGAELAVAHTWMDEKQWFAVLLLEPSPA
jgi:L-histidine Nalpha-methyltransferase